MDALGFASRRSFSEVHGARTQRNCIEQLPRATASAGRVNVNSRNIFQRALIWIKGWVQSRVKAASLNRALVPFIKAAKTDSATVIRPHHLKKLAAVMADGAKQHDVSLVAEVVRDNVNSLDLTGLKRLRIELGKLTPSGTPFERTLLETVDGSINDAKVTEAKRNLSKVLTSFSRLFASPSDASFVLPDIHHYLLTILKLVQPAGDSPQKIEFKSASSVITTETLTEWFDGYSLPEKQRVKANLRSIAIDSSITRASPEADRAMKAFCRFVTTLI